MTEIVKLSTRMALLAGVTILMVVSTGHRAVAQSPRSSEPRTAEAPSRTADGTTKPAPTSSPIDNALSAVATWFERANREYQTIVTKDLSVPTEKGLAEARRTADPKTTAQTTTSPSGSGPSWLDRLQSLLGLGGPPMPRNPDAPATTTAGRGGGGAEDRTAGTPASRPPRASEFETARGDVATDAATRERQRAAAEARARAANGGSSTSVGAPSPSSGSAASPTAPVASAPVTSAPSPSASPPAASSTATVAPPPARETSPSVADKRPEPEPRRSVAEVTKPVAPPTAPTKPPATTEQPAARSAPVTAAETRPTRTGRITTTEITTSELPKPRPPAARATEPDDDDDDDGDRGEQTRRPTPSARQAPAKSGPSRTASCKSAGRRVDPPGTYVVKPGDNLWTISRRHYAKGSMYQRIVDANPEQIDDPDLIFPCQRLRLPS